MAKYSSLLKDKLKELLSSRGLPTDGTKEQLIGRLEESDKVAAELDEAEEDEEAPAVAPVPVSVPAVTPTTATTATPAEEIPVPVQESAPVAETVDAPVDTAPAAENGEAAPVPTEEKKAISPEELKEAAIELLNKKIARAEKFGEDDQVKKLTADLKRIEKFGISLDSSIAKELGYQQPKQLNKVFHKKGSNRAGHSGQRGGFRNDSNKGINNRGGRIYKTRRY